MQRNKVHCVRTISLVASELGETEAWLHEIAEEMDTEDGLIWVYSPKNPNGVIAFSEDGVRSLLELIAIHRPVA
jgi:hypothetical protein